MSWDHIDPASQLPSVDRTGAEPDRSPSLLPTQGERQAQTDLLSHEQHEVLQAERLRATGLIFDMTV
ncbi:MAG: hypothetical protein AB7D57_10180 [Desulfovibrionaceae bacterium]